MPLANRSPSLRLLLGRDRVFYCMQPKTTAKKKKNKSPSLFDCTSCWADFCISISARRASLLLLLDGPVQQLQRVSYSLCSSLDGSLRMMRWRSVRECAALLVHVVKMSLSLLFPQVTPLNFTWLQFQFQFALFFFFFLFCISSAAITHFSAAPCVESVALSTHL